MQCKLCQKEATLRRSHIVPEFVYKPVYDADHTAVMFEAKKPRHGYRRKGFWNHLFCDDCEARFQRLEDYFADIWFTRPLRPQNFTGPVVHITGLDYCKFKLFHLSILWRADVSGLAVFADVSLGRRHSEELRRRILEGDPGSPDIYPITGLALRNTNGSFKDDLMLLPGGSNTGGHHIYIMLFGGVFWACAVSGHRQACPVPPSLQDDGSITLFVQEWTENSAVRNLAKQLQTHFKKS